MKKLAGLLFAFLVRTFLVEICLVQICLSEICLSEICFAGSATSRAPRMDLKGVSLLVNLPVILVANPAVPAQTVNELIAYDKNNPSKLNFGSSGTGGINHLSGELFNQLASTHLTYIPYNGTAPAMQDLIAGNIQLMFDAISTSLPNIKAGLIKPIAWTGAKASPVLPDLPTIAASSLADYDTTSWLAMFASADAPTEVIDETSEEVRIILDQPMVRDRQEAQGIEFVASTPRQLDAMVRSQIPRRSEFIKKFDIEVE